MKIPAIKFKLPAMTVRNRLRGVLGLLGVMLIAGAAIGLGAMHLQNEGMRSMYDDELVPTEIISRINTPDL